jgi:hypothetical protein
MISPCADAIGCSGQIRSSRTANLAVPGNLSFLVEALERVRMEKNEIIAGFRPDERSKTEQTNYVRHPVRIFVSA